MGDLLNGDLLLRGEGGDLRLRSLGAEEFVMSPPTIESMEKPSLPLLEEAESREVGERREEDNSEGGARADMGACWAGNRDMLTTVIASYHSKTQRRYPNTDQLHLVQTKQEQHLCLFVTINRV